MYIIKYGGRGRQTQKIRASTGRRALRIRASSIYLLIAVDPTPS